MSSLIFSVNSEKEKLSAAVVISALGFNVFANCSFFYPSLQWGLTVIVVIADNFVLYLNLTYTTIWAKSADKY